jgi:hypothetical protein
MLQLNRVAADRSWAILTQIFLQKPAWVRVGLGSSTAVAKKREVLRVLSREKTVPALPRKKNLISKRESTDYTSTINNQPLINAFNVFLCSGYLL